MNIREAEAASGITKQNIRFYERKGLLHPERNMENDYRQYSDEDIRRLKSIRMLRRLDFPVEEIRKILEGSEEFKEAVKRQIESLKSRKQDLADQIEFLERIEKDGADLSRQEQYLKAMEQAEHQGVRFLDILKDYKKVAQSEMKKRFTFVPDTMATTPREFTEELLRFADQEKLNLVVTKEGMIPRFQIDGVEYEAFRLSGRFGITIQCEMTHPEDADTETGASQVSRGKRWWLRLLHYGAPVMVCAAAVFSIMGFHWWSVLTFIGISGAVCCGGLTYWNLKN